MLGRALALVSAALVFAACGPSFQVVYEGDARFEHCYAIDETPTVSLQEKTECWTEWTKHYAYGQTRNRIDYAYGRARALQEVPAAPTDEAIMGAAPGGATTHVLGQDEPVTTNAFATPPKTMAVNDGGADGAPPEKVSMAAIATAPEKAVVLPAPPAETCTDRCHTTWENCRKPCKDGACKTCDKGYGACMKGCF